MVKYLQFIGYYPIQYIYLYTSVAPKALTERSERHGVQVFGLAGCESRYTGFLLKADAHACLERSEESGFVLFLQSCLSV